MASPKSSNSIFFQKTYADRYVLTLRSFYAAKDLALLQSWREQSPHLHFTLSSAPSPSCFPLLVLADEEIVCYLELLSASLVLPTLLHLPEEALHLQYLFQPHQTFSSFYFTILFDWLTAQHDSYSLYASVALFQHSTCRELEQLGFLFQRNVILPQQAAHLYLRHS